MKLTPPCRSRGITRQRELIEKANPDPQGQDPPATVPGQDGLGSGGHSGAASVCCLSGRPLPAALGVTMDPTTRNQPMEHAEPRFDRDTIGELRRRVIAHNEAMPDSTFHV